MQRLDLNAVPSAMETMASTWAKQGPQPPKPKLQPQRSSAPLSPRIQRPPQDRRRDLKLPPGDEVKAERDYHMDVAAMRRLLADPEPIPADYVMTLAAKYSTALMQARRCPDPAFAGHMEVPPGPLVPQMLRMGLLCRIGSRNRILSTFALDVRREIMRDIG